MPKKFVEVRLNTGDFPIVPTTALPLKELLDSELTQTNFKAVLGSKLIAKLLEYADVTASGVRKVIVEPD